MNNQEYYEVAPKRLKCKGCGTKWPLMMSKVRKYHKPLICAKCYFEAKWAAKSGEVSLAT